MLSERKKYNYNISTTQTSIPSSRSRQLPSSGSSSAYKSSVQPLYQNQNINVDYVEEYTGSQSKRIVELEAVNKRMLEETTKQFQKFQADVVKVEGILRIKEQQVERLEQETRQLTEDKAALIEALNEKQAIIVQFHVKLKQLIEERQSRKAQQREVIPISTQTHLTPLIESTAQTEQIPTSGPSTQEYAQLRNQLHTYVQKYQIERSKNQQLTEQVYKLKQEVYEVTSELGLAKQQFETYKLLQEIEEVRKQ